MDLAETGLASHALIAHATMLEHKKNSKSVLFNPQRSSAPAAGRACCMLAGHSETLSLPQGLLEKHS